MSSSENAAAALRKYRFFQTFSDHLIAQVAKFAKLVYFDADQEIMHQGQLNNLLHFLESGEVKIKVDKETVAILSEKGEVFGEMSVISQLPVSASVVAHINTACYVINAEDFTKVAPADLDHFLYLLHKIYSVVVTDRLRLTNKKARDFEITARKLTIARDDLESLNKNLEQKVEERTVELSKKATELKASYAQLEQKSAALSAGYKKVTDLARYRDESIKRIRDMTDVHLAPVARSLELLSNHEVGPHRDLVLRAQSEIDSLKADVVKLSEWDLAERSREQKKVLLLDSDRKQQLVAKMALGGTGVTLEIADDPSPAMTAFDMSSYDLLFCSIPHSENLRTANELNFKGQMVLFTSNDVQSYLPTLKTLPFVENVVSRDPNDRTFTVKNIVTTMTKILNEDYFGLEKYLSWGVDVREKYISQSNQRQNLNNEMQEYMKSLGIRNSIIDRCVICTEEMLMNAIYDAPSDLNGNAIFNHLSRNVEIELAQDQASLFRYACDGNLVAVSVQDPFGALLKSHIIDYLESCYQGQAGKFNTNKGGAGRGLHQIIENSDLTIFNVKKGVRTEVISIFNIDTAAKKEGSQPTFHYFFS